jgi:hypothetical protein
MSGRASGVIPRGRAGASASCGRGGVAQVGQSPQRLSVCIRIVSPLSLVVIKIAAVIGFAHHD